MVFTSSAFAGWGDKTETIKFMSKDLSGIEDVLNGIENGKDIEISGKLTIPKQSSEGKIPCMVWMHGSGGISQNSDKRVIPWLNMFHTLGIATFRINSFKPRGVKNTYKNQNAVNSSEMGVDVYKALDVLSNHERIDKHRIGIIGASKGGTVSYVTHWKLFYNAMGTSEKFALHVSLYPTAYEFETMEFTDAPLLVLVGEKDDWTPAKPWPPIIDKMKRAGYTADVIIYEDTYHSFDATYNVFTSKDGDSYMDCRYKILDNGKVFEKTSGLFQGEVGFGNCINTTSGVKLGYNSKAKKDARKRVTELVTNVFKLEPITEKVVKKSDNSNTSTDR